MSINDAIDAGAKRLPKNSHKRQIRDVCIWTIRKTEKGESIKCGKVFKSFEALKNHINIVHKGIIKSSKNLKGDQKVLV